MNPTIRRMLGSSYTTQLGLAAVRPFANATEADRTGILVYNRSTSATITVGDSDQVATTGGWFQIAPGETRFIPFSASTEFWAISSAANTDWRCRQIVA